MARFHFPHCRMLTASLILGRHGEQRPIMKDGKATIDLIH